MSLWQRELPAASIELLVEAKIYLIVFPGHLKSYIGVESYYKISKLLEKVLWEFKDPLSIYILLLLKFSIILKQVQGSYLDELWDTLRVLRRRYISILSNYSFWVIFYLSFCIFWIILGNISFVILRFLSWVICHL